MRELMTRKRYQEITRTELPVAFPWASDAIMAVAPGHIEIANRYLSDVEAIVGREGLSQGLRFLRINDTEEMGLRVYIDVEGLSAVRSSAVQDAGTAAAEASRRACAACGARVDRRERYCSDHAAQAVLFADDAPAQTRLADGDPDLPCADDGAAVSLREDEADPCLPFPFPEVPRLVVYSSDDIARLEKSTEGKDSETRDRIRGVVKRLRDVPGAKPLALVPDDWKEKLDRLEADFPNFVEFVEFLRDRFALAELGDRSIDIPPVLFDGPPGIGKTEVALSLAALIDTGSMEIDMAVAQSSAALCGSEAFWANTREGRLFEALAYGGTANPLVFLDELDKVGGDERYRPDSALYQLLEPRTAAAFRDLSVRELNLDASRVLWFAATNELERVSPPIRSRFVTFRVPAPTPEQCKAIAHSIYRRLLARNAWGAAMAPGISEDVAGRLADLPPRMTRIKLSQACGRAARQGRREIRVEDIVLGDTARRHGIGFVREAA